MKTLKKRFDNMKKITDESERHIVVSIRRKHLDKAKSLGFSSLDAYIEYLEALLKQQQQPQQQSEAQSRSEA